MIEDYASLQTNILSFLNRSDAATTAKAPTFVQLAEDELKLDHRVREETCRGTWTIQADGDALPADFGEIDEWAHDGPTYYGVIEVVKNLGALKAARGFTAAGVPRYASIRDGRVYYAPEPSDTFTTRMSYLRKLTPLSDENTTNWLLEDHPMIYLAASLKHGYAWLKDERQAEWAGKLDVMLDKMQRARWSAGARGATVRRWRRPIG